MVDRDVTSVFVVLNCCELLLSEGNHVGMSVSGGICQMSFRLRGGLFGSIGLGLMRLSWESIILIAGWLSNLLGSWLGLLDRLNLLDWLNRLRLFRLCGLNRLRGSWFGEVWSRRLGSDDCWLF